MVSILVSTRNRHEALRRMLESLQEMDVPSGNTVEVLVMDNGSTDETSSVLAGFGATLQTNVELRSQYVAQPGKSKALNVAMDLARGQILAFIDDDVRVDKSWLTQLLDAFRSGADAVQGGIRLTHSGPGAWWISPRVEAICAATTLWTAATPVTTLVGSNMAVRNDGRVPHFCEEIGPGQEFPMGEDSEWSRRTLSDGRKAVYWPAMSAAHDLGERLSFAEVQKRQFYSGFNGLVFADPQRRNHLLFRCLRDLPISLAKVLARAAMGRRPDALDHWLDALRHCGCVLAPLLGAHRHPCWDVDIGNQQPVSRRNHP